MRITPKMKQLSKENEESQYFTYKGVLFRIVGTKRNKNGSYTHLVKNTKMTGFEAFKEVGAVELEKIITNKC